MYLNDIRTYANILSTPNNILGIEYLKSLKRIKSPIRPMNIQREGVGYNDLGIKVNLASATAIRNMIINNVLSKLPYVMPNSSYRVLYNSFSKSLTNTL